ncbi:5-oxoprolinase subunit PxpA [Microbacterium chocolatum]|uniref:5-oxoprolinase subunit PxpA n=1 Tax=Microbacterium aurantiacum TaxID=162393 RepID=UPI00338F97F2
MRPVTVNADLGESIGIHSFGNDDDLLAIVDSVNIACGMHAGDPSEMRRVIEKSVERGVTIGAHPGLPDMVGFGRRAMALDAEEVRDLVRYQVGALAAFLDAAGAPLHHVKPHGALFGMTLADVELMRGVCEVALQFDVGVYGLQGTAHEEAARDVGVPFFSELYVDLDYDDNGVLIIERRARPTDASAARERVREAVDGRALRTASGRVRDVSVDTVCVHSDLPNAVEIARAVRGEIDSLTRA